VSQGALDTLLKLFGAESAPVEKLLMEEARDALAKLEAEFGEPHGVSASLHLETGVVLRAILDQADAMDARLLVVGARGESALRPLLLGSTAERLLRRTLRPILVVKKPPQAAYRRYSYRWIFTVVIVRTQAGQRAGAARRAGFVARL